ncbi:hypothetical protein BDF14DRAFT_1799158 [Spinellus fusiger]|nr:hypothetical protein BDF14DRAFT_1799158 [Spinellus fusiger]
MSQFKQLPEVAENPSTPSRISTRRSVRSQRSDSPSTAKDSSEAHPQTSTPTKSDSTRTTSPHPSEPGRKKPRKTRAPYKKKRDNASKPLGREDTDRETRHTSQRMSKEAKEAKKAERDFIIQQRLSDLEKIEESVKNHSHPEYHRLMEEIKTKYSEKKKEVEISYTLVETNYRNILSSQHKMANDQFHVRNQEQLFSFFFSFFLFFFFSFFLF